MTPTARTLNLLRHHGWIAEPVERFIHQCNVRKDFLGCIDLLAVKAGEPVLGIQATSGSNHAARVAKSKREPRLRTWLATGSRFEVWSWSKIEGNWQARKTPLVLDELATNVAAIDPPRRKRRKAELLLFS